MVYWIAAYDGSTGAPQGSMTEGSGLSKTVMRSGCKKHSTVFSLRSQNTRRWKLNAVKSDRINRDTSRTNGRRSEHTVAAAEGNGRNTDPTPIGICDRDLLAYETQMPTATPCSNRTQLQIHGREGEGMNTPLQQLKGTVAIRIRRLQGSATGTC